jgi:5'-3' exonuclease
MILIDFSSIIHRMIHTSVANAKPKMVDGKFATSEFIGLTKYFILQELFNIYQEHNRKFNDIVICLDKSSDGYWRKDFYPMYKAGRKKGREESDINFKEVFSELDELINQIKSNLPWKVVSVPKAEADDIMLVLSREYNTREKILIHTPDKDMIQAQRNTENVFQYSALTKKWIVPENKHDHMDHWLMEHVILGDASDEVPKVTDHTEFSQSFLDYLKENNISEDFFDVYSFKYGNNGIQLSKEYKIKLLDNFNVYKLNRKKESTGIKDVYKDIKFGPSTLQKEIAKFGSVNEWLKSHPLYKEHYERNFTLVMEEGIPNNIWNEIVISYKEADVTYNEKEFKEYLTKNELKSVLMDLPMIFKSTRKLTVENCDW